MKEDTYEVYVFCENCYFKGKISIAKGFTVEQTKCPNCANNTLRTDPNGELFDRPPKTVSYL